MKGQILDFSIQNNGGIISAEDGKRYSFVNSEWKENTNPVRGMWIDFEVNEEGQAIAIYKALPSSNRLSSMSLTEPFTSTGKKKNVAGLLALFLGGLGAHKFYLGFTLPAVIYLLGSFGCIVLFSITEEDVFTIPWLIISIFSLIDAILYFTKPEEDFQQVYVEGKKQWF